MYNKFEDCIASVISDHVSKVLPFIKFRSTTKFEKTQLCSFLSFSRTFCIYFVK